MTRVSQSNKTLNAASLGLPPGMFSQTELNSIAKLMQGMETMLANMSGTLPAMPAINTGTGTYSQQSATPVANVPMGDSKLSRTKPNTTPLDFDVMPMLPQSLKPYAGVLQRYGEVQNAKGKPFKANDMRSLITRLAPLIGIIETECQQQGVEPAFALSVMLQESAGKTNAKNDRSGASGLWQFMPATARDQGLVVNNTTDERFDIRKSTKAAIGYIAMLDKRFNKDKLAVLAAYNWGMGNVDKHLAGQKSLPTETRGYISAIPYFAGMDA